MWSSTYFLGNFLGPTVSGFLVDAYDFEWTTVVFCGIYCIAAIMDLCELTYSFLAHKKKLAIEMCIQSF